MKKMRDTLEYRQHLIHDPDRSSTVLSVFPRLLDTKGLILQDFRLLFGSETSSKLLEKWQNSFKAKVIKQADMLFLTSTPLLMRLLLSAKNQHADEPLPEFIMIVKVVGKGSLLSCSFQLTVTGVCPAEVGSNGATSRGL
ncbi:hypothetical protein AAFF_G00085990 [Aldrovandia affinis]|uniref:Uncharacterized protein n=1 Tax=Aldrovandia affinis TaxID=143900 RepID=A0AAD7VXZ1_9TELE|nr:hypothetical protein AAFF_G00085990 [Aldrovandia affinis]